MAEKTVQDWVDEIPEGIRGKVWHQLGSELHGGARTQDAPDSGNNIPTPPPPPTHG